MKNVAAKESEGSCS